MSDIYVIVPKEHKNPFPAHTTWQGAAEELGQYPAHIQDCYHVLNTELIDDEDS